MPYFTAQGVMCHVPSSCLVWGLRRKSKNVYGYYLYSSLSTLYIQYHRAGTTNHPHGGAGDHQKCNDLHLSAHFPEMAEDTAELHPLQHGKCIHLIDCTFRLMFFWFIKGINVWWERKHSMMCSTDLQSLKMQSEAMLLKRDWRMYIYDYDPLVTISMRNKKVKRNKRKSNLSL